MHRDMFGDLVRVHSLLRRDLERVRYLAGQVQDGMPADGAAAEVAELAEDSLVWQLRLRCLHYCQFVHSHHTVEDAAMFPALRRINPVLGPAIDRLEADHREVAARLRRVEADATAYAAEPTVEGRDRLSAALDALADQLLDHLDFEEDSLQDTLRRVTFLPG